MNSGDTVFVRRVSVCGVGWSENDRKFFTEFQLARYVKRCQYVNRTLCKTLKNEQFFDLPS